MHAAAAILALTACGDVTEPELGPSTRPFAAAATPSAVVPNAIFTVTSTAATGTGSLHQAILDANASPGLDAIHFSIPGTGPHTIRPVQLPFITDPIIVDGYTQPGASPNSNGPGSGNNAVLMIELDGTNSGHGTFGLTVTGGGSTIRGLVINRFMNRGFPPRGTGAIHLSGPGGNAIEGNRLGTDPSGSSAVLGMLYGVYVDNSPDNRAGGLDPAAQNLISGTGNGVAVLGAGATGNRIQGNLIGTDASGTQAIGNSTGVILGASGNVVGGPSPEARNVVSGNGNFGVAIGGYSASGNLVQGNLVGTDVTGTLPLGNYYAGIRVSHAPGNIIGGSSPGAGNVVSANGTGIDIGNPGAESNLVQGNLVGTDITGSLALGNDGQGVLIQAPNNLVGGAEPGAGNVVAASGDDGIHVVLTFGGGVRVEGNLIGTDARGSSPLGNTHNGLFVEYAVDGTTEIVGNTMSGNGRSGLWIDRSAYVAVHGNRIGTSVTGTAPLGNARDGVTITFSRDASVGGAGPGHSNRIAFNQRSGVGVLCDNSVGNSIQGNSIYSNGGLGINLYEYCTSSPGDGVTPNDPGDLDTGPNDFQNFPVLASVGSCGSNTVIAGTIESTPNETFLVQLFSSSEADPSGHGEGEVFLGQIHVTTDAGGWGSFEVPLGTGVADGHVVTATATNAAGGTSEFSAAVAVVHLTPPELIALLRDAVLKLAAEGAFQSPEQANGLLNKLAQAGTSVDSDRPNAAMLLGGFVAEIEGLVTGGVLTPEQAEPLVDAAECAMGQLG